jgi:CheY-like chemotaxis protein
MVETQPAVGSADQQIAMMDRGNVMVVDDQPANLRLMEDMLRQAGYRVRSFPRGRMALNAAAQQAPDLILLDISMPEMDGFEMCGHLKADKKLSAIPVIFLSALNETEDKVKAFHAGGVDYITKPFQFEEVQARVETHMGLQRARRAERDLLENTLNGAVRTIADLVHQTGPALGARSDAIRDIVVHLTSQLRLENPWQYELAATLCLIGCIALPAEVFERVYGRAPKGSDEEMFHAHPENGARLLAKIPRLEIVSEMIRRHQTAGGNAPPEGAAELGACILRIAVELDRWMFQGLSFDTALVKLKAIPRGFPPEMIEALRNYSPSLVPFEIKALELRDLMVSMITEEDIITKDGTFLILRKGSVLNAATIEKIRNFDKTRRICQPIRVKVPQSHSPRVLSPA